MCPSVSIMNPFNLFFSTVLLRLFYHSHLTCVVGKSSNTNHGFFAYGYVFMMILSGET